MLFQTSGSSMSHFAYYCREASIGRKRHWGSFALAGMLALLGACSGDGKNAAIVPPSSITEHTSGPPRVGLILPLSGPHAAIGQRMRDAARLALPEGQMPEMDVFDSAAPGGAAKAALAALAAGDRIILGPLMAGETEQVADIVQPAHVPEIAFTSDVEQSRPGVWVMGLTPEQQVRRLVDAAAAEGRQHFAAFLPDNALGHALAEGLTRICQEKGLEIPQITFHSRDVTSITNGLATLSAVSRRHVVLNLDNTDVMPFSSSETNGITAVDAPDPSALSSADHAAPSGETTQGNLSGNMAPPPFDALLLGDTGLDLANVIKAMKADQIDSLTIRVMGPSLWKAFDNKLGDLRGAWYAASDDQQRGDYVQHYQAVYHQLPSPVTDFSYDAAALAGALIQKNSLDMETLMRPNGFSGVNGVFHLLENGRVMRTLGVYQILLGGGAYLVIPASQDLSSGLPSRLSPSVQGAAVAKPVKQQQGHSL